METTKKKRGRPSQGKVARPYTYDRDVAAFMDSLPDGARSRFVNAWLRENPEFLAWKAHRS
ncbi:hypothetical protein KDI_55490 [Dictyobacter arantiisoli]|uniref:Uncharacterized protein n=1 Tax=Dictyobacter arantiisoli TaxID=2014874 RepID=A0A5A5TKZ4_9CHLR|nr:hypothetical protein KDI_55490 [Dictyobacter arantiisoli]